MIRQGCRRIRAAENFTSSLLHIPAMNFCVAGAGAAFYLASIKPSQHFCVDMKY
jgi:hypothetical protein